MGTNKHNDYFLRKNGTAQSGDVQLSFNNMKTIAEKLMGYRVTWQPAIVQGAELGTLFVETSLESQKFSPTGTKFRVSGTADTEQGMVLLLAELIKDMTDNLTKDAYKLLLVYNELKLEERGGDDDELNNDESDNN